MNAIELIQQAEQAEAQGVPVDWHVISGRLFQTANNFAAQQDQAINELKEKVKTLSDEIHSLHTEGEEACGCEVCIEYQD